MFHRQNRQRGGVAIEYIIVSSFGILLSLAAVAYVGKIVKQKLSKLEQRTGEEFQFDPEVFDEGQ